MNKHPFGLNALVSFLALVSSLSAYAGAGMSSPKMTREEAKAELIKHNKNVYKANSSYLSAKAMNPKNMPAAKKKLDEAREELKKVEKAHHAAVETDVASKNPNLDRKSPGFKAQVDSEKVKDVSEADKAATGSSR